MKNKNSKELTFTCNVEIYDNKNNIVNTGVITHSLGIPKLDIPKIDRNAVTKWQNKVMGEIDIIHTGKGLVPQEQFGKKFEYIPCLLEQPYVELMDFNEFKKIWSRGREEPKPTLIFKGGEFKRFEHLIDDAIKRDYEITSENGEVKFIPKKK